MLNTVSVSKLAKYLASDKEFCDNVTSVIVKSVEPGVRPDQNVICPRKFGVLVESLYNLHFLNDSKRAFYIPENSSPPLYPGVVVSGVTSYVNTLGALMAVENVMSANSLSYEAQDLFKISNPQMLEIAQAAYHCVESAKKLVPDPNTSQFHVSDIDYAPNAISTFEEDGIIWNIDFVQGYYVVDMHVSSRHPHMEKWAQVLLYTQLMRSRNHGVYKGGRILNPLLGNLYSADLSHNLAKIVQRYIDDWKTIVTD